MTVELPSAIWVEMLKQVILAGGCAWSCRSRFSSYELAELVQVGEGCWAAADLGSAIRMLHWPAYCSSIVLNSLVIRQNTVYFVSHLTCAAGVHSLQNILTSSAGGVSPDWKP